MAFVCVYVFACFATEQTVANSSCTLVYVLTVVDCTDTNVRTNWFLPFNSNKTPSNNDMNYERFSDLVCITIHYVNIYMCVRRCVRTYETYESEIRCCTFCKPRDAQIRCTMWNDMMLCAKIPTFKLKDEQFPELLVFNVSATSVCLFCNK